MTHLGLYIFNRKNLVVSITVALIMLLLSTNFSSALEYTKVGNLNATAPEIIGKSALLYSLDLDEVVYSKNPDLKCDPYSVTKLMTAYLAAENLDLNDSVTVSQKAANDFLDGSTMFLQKGEDVTVEELLYGTLLTSGNDAAYSLAEAVSGDQATFAELMNETAKKWGCENTHFVNASGYKAKNHYATANDLLIISRNVLKNETIAKIVFTKKYKMRATNKYKERILKNHTNVLRKKDSGILGGKTGYWDQSDCSIVIQYCKHELSAILIILKDTEKGRVQDAKTLLNFAHDVIPGYRVASKGDEIKTIWVKHGARTRVKTVVKDSIFAYPPNQSKHSIRVKRIINKGIIAPLRKGDVVGKIEVYVKGHKVGEQNLLAAEDVKVGWLPSYIYIPNAVTACFVLIIILLIALILILRKINKNKRKQRRTL